MGQVGDQLRQAREAKRLTLEQVEEITKIRRRYLQALEEEDYGQLPGEVFIRGFLRNYAQALGLDPDEILVAAGRKALNPLASAQPPDEAYLDEPLVEPSTGQRVVSVAIGAMVLVVVALSAWTLYHYLGPASNPPPLPPPVAAETPALAGYDEPTAGPTFTPLALRVTPLALRVTPQPTAAPTATPTSMTTSAPTSTPTATYTPEPTAVPPTAVPDMGVILRLEATQVSWVRVEVDAALAYEGTMSTGQILEWQGAGQIYLRTGNAGGLRVWYNGQEEPPLGGSGQVVERTWQAGQLPPPGEPTPEGTAAPLGPPPEPSTPNP